MHIAARGQTGYEYDYWFDNDRSTMQSGTSIDGNIQLYPNLEELSDALHTLHIQVRNDEGMLSSLVTRYFIKSPVQQIRQLMYWFDNDDANIIVASNQQGVSMVDVSQLTDGFHILHCQLRGQSSYSTISSHAFLKLTTHNNIKWRCWFDDDFNHIQSGSDTDGTLLIDVSQLSDGFHLLNMQIEGNGSVSNAVTHAFIKVPQVKDVDHLTCLCMIDGELYKQEDVSADGYLLHWQFDVSALPQGLHHVAVQIISPSGAASTSYHSFFMRVPTENELDNMKCVYAIDGSEFYTEAGQLQDGNYHFDLDVASLENGLHRISYMLSNGKGVNTKAQTQFFVKTPLGGNGITEYWYWQNEQGDSLAKKMVLAERQNPYSLISLLPVESQPIRSRCFEFKIKEEQPIIFAKNDIHIRFYDASGRFTDVSKQYVDESVKQEVTDSTPLEPGIRATADKPAENTIKWYCVEAERGDSLQFKLDRAATIQLFAPSGKEVFSASGSESVKWGGLHAAENGTYYVALHDVTATQGTTVSIDYNHIDKYAVLRQDVAIVGNGGCSTITFEGNGFKDLYAVDLYNAQGDTIKHVYIGHENNATTSVVFDFSDAATGKYHALFRFAEEDKVFTNLVTVEEAKDIELATEVTFPSTFPHGLSTTYTVKITNKGNMTAYAVPVYTWIMNKLKKNGIYHIEYEGLDLPGVFDGVDMDSLSVNEKAELQALSEEIGDGHYFMIFRVEDENSPGDSIWVRSNYFFTNIAPYETKTLRLILSAEEGVWAYFTVPEDWPSFGSEEDLSNSRRTMAKYKSPSLIDKYCCYKDRVECVVSVLADVTNIAKKFSEIWFPGTPTDVGLGAASCMMDAFNQIVSATGNVMCGQSAGEDKAWEMTQKVSGGLSVASTLSSCASKLFPLGRIKTLLEGINKIVEGDNYITGINMGIDFLKCQEAFSQQVPTCPPNPNPGGGSSGGGGSWDPNDIYGYLSPSGSKFMTDSVTMMNYTIEFENDTTFATAAAYKVVVCDTLDSSCFDFASYAPTSVRIGSRQASLDGSQNFVTTIDMRPEIYVIVQVEGNYDALKGIMTWTFTSLDPMTMEPATDIMQGFLPVNYSGNGIGEVSYVVSKKTGLMHGTEISNHASITFDVNEPILTPTWTNIIDCIAPESHVADVQMATDSTATVRIEATDELSGPWRYDVYVQYGEGAGWWKAAENVPVDTRTTVKVYKGINHGFYVVVTDSAGNVEQKNAEREYTFEMFDSQMDTDTQIELAEGWNWISHNQQEPLAVEALKPSSLRMVGQTNESRIPALAGWATWCNCFPHRCISYRRKGR